MFVNSYLKELRIKQGMTQKEMADKLGITKSSWAMYERGERVPRDEIKVKIAKFFGTTVEPLFFANIEHK